MDVETPTVGTKVVHRVENFGEGVIQDPTDARVWLWPDQVVVKWETGWVATHDVGELEVVS